MWFCLLCYQGGKDQIILEKIRVHSKTIMKLKLQALDFFLTIAGDMEHTVCGPHNGNGVG